MATKVEELFEYLEGARIGGITLGTNPNVTTEEVAGAILESLKELEDKLERGEELEELKID